MREEVISQISHALRHLQQRNRFVRYDQDTGLTIVESFILLTVDAPIPYSGSTLSSMMKVDRSTVSRALTSLVAAGLLTRQYGVTKQGRKFLDEYDESSNAILRDGLLGFSENETNRLGKYFKIIADGSGAPEGHLRSNDHEIRLHIRRLTCSFGVLSTSFLGCGVNSTKWQILSEVKNRAIAPTIGDLAAALSINPHQMSLIVTKLDGDRLLARVSDDEDARRVRLKILAKGKNIVETVESAGDAILTKAFTSSSLSELRDAAALIRRYVGDEGDSTSRSPLHGLLVKVLRSEEERQLVRGKVLASLVDSDLHGDAPEIIVGKAHNCFVLLRGDEPLAFLEVETSPTAEPAVWIYLALGKISVSIVREFHKRCAERLGTTPEKIPLKEGKIVSTD